MGGRGLPKYITVQPPEADPRTEMQNLRSQSNTAWLGPTHGSRAGCGTYLSSNASDDLKLGALRRFSLFFDELAPVTSRWQGPELLEFSVDSGSSY